MRLMYTKMFEIIRSRIIFGVLQVDPALKQQYAANYHVKPSGDADVIERQQLIQSMMQAWPVIQNTAAAQQFLIVLIGKMFPEDAPKYIAAIQQAQQQQQQQAQSQQAQMLQQAMGVAQQVGKGILNLNDHPEYWSDAGKVWAKPGIEDAAKQVKAFQDQMNAAQSQRQPRT